jgi:hypothetical protein
VMLKYLFLFGSEVEHFPPVYFALHDQFERLHKRNKIQ